MRHGARIRRVPLLRLVGSRRTARQERRRPHRK
jgi:hypothetical protein